MHCHPCTRAPVNIVSDLSSLELCRASSAQCPSVPRARRFGCHPAQHLWSEWALFNKECSLNLLPDFRSVTSHKPSVHTIHKELPFEPNAMRNRSSRVRNHLLRYDSIHVARENTKENIMQALYFIESSSTRKLQRINIMQWRGFAENIGVVIHSSEMGWYIAK